MQYLTLEDGDAVNVSELAAHLQVPKLRAQGILKQIEDDTHYIEAGETCRLTERGRNYVLNRRWA